MVNKFVILLIMIFLHIVDDYYLQGLLAKYKQKEWWIENAPDKLYKHDYITALITHAFSWTFMIMLPYTILFYGILDWKYIYAFISNWIVHTIVDHLKANCKIINLTTDQITHLVQIIITWLVLFH